jgi:hypothetical protein
MGGAPTPKPLPALPEAPDAETDPGIEAAKQREITRLAHRRSRSSTKNTKSTQGGTLEGGAPDLFKTKLGGA